MKKYVMVIIGLIIPFAIFAQVGARHIENTGNFSICPPRNWTILEMPGLKYSIFYGISINDFAPNIFIVDEYYQGSLDEYVRISNQNVRLMFPDNELINTQQFVTNSGLIGIKQVYRSANSGQLLRQIFYYFSSSSQKYVITCSVPNSEGERYESIFDESIKSFEVIRR